MSAAIISASLSKDQIPLLAHLSSYIVINSTDSTPTISDVDSNLVNDEMLRRKKFSRLIPIFSFSSTRNQLDIYRIMLSDKKYGLSVNMMATRVLPSLVPQTVNPSLNLEQFMILLEVSDEFRKQDTIT